MLLWFLSSCRVWFVYIPPLFFFFLLMIYLLHSHCSFQSSIIFLLPPSFVSSSSSSLSFYFYQYYYSVWENSANKFERHKLEWMNSSGVWSTPTRWLLWLSRKVSINLFLFFVNYSLVTTTDLFYIYHIYFIYHLITMTRRQEISAYLVDVIQAIAK